VSKALYFSGTKTIFDDNASVIPELQQEFARSQGFRAEFHSKRGTPRWGFAQRRMLCRDTPDIKARSFAIIISYSYAIKGTHLGGPIGFFLVAASTAMKRKRNASFER
jgi:hypothetical protein